MQHGTKTDTEQLDLRTQIHPRLRRGLRCPARRGRRRDRKGHPAGQEDQPHLAQRIRVGRLSRPHGGAKAHHVHALDARGVPQELHRPPLHRHPHEQIHLLQSLFRLLRPPLRASVRRGRGAAAHARRQHRKGRLQAQLQGSGHGRAHPPCGDRGRTGGRARVSARKFRRHRGRIHPAAPDARAAQPRCREHRALLHRDRAVRDISVRPGCSRPPSKRTSPTAVRTR